MTTAILNISIFFIFLFVLCLFAIAFGIIVIATAMSSYDPMIIPPPYVEAHKRYIESMNKKPKKRKPKSTCTKPDCPAEW